MFNKPKIKMEKDIEAFDTDGNRFVKTIEVYEGFNQKKDKYGYYGRIISFGWPCEYYINSLLRDYPYSGDFCIDVGGRNHRGHQTYISKDDMNEILKTFKEKSYANNQKNTGKVEEGSSGDERKG